MSPISDCLESRQEILQRLQRRIGDDDFEAQFSDAADAIHPPMTKDNWVMRYSTTKFAYVKYKRVDKEIVAVDGDESSDYDDNDDDDDGDDDDEEDDNDDDEEDSDDGDESSDYGDDEVCLFE